MPEVPTEVSKLVAKFEQNITSYQNPAYGADTTRLDKTVVLVERMLDLHKQLETAKNPNDKTRLEREINATDGQIDPLVYELYSLTEEEIKIVEDATR